MIRFVTLRSTACVFVSFVLDNEPHPTPRRLRSSTTRVGSPRSTSTSPLCASHSCPTAPQIDRPRFFVFVLILLWLVPPNLARCLAPHGVPWLVAGFGCSGLARHLSSTLYRLENHTRLCAACVICNHTVTRPTSPWFSNYISDNSRIARHEAICRSYPLYV